MPYTPLSVKREHWGFEPKAWMKRCGLFFQHIRDQIGERIERFAKTGSRIGGHCFLVKILYYPVQRTLKYQVTLAPMDRNAASRSLQFLT